ncbi:MAG TPA: alpha/beta hydrolase [Xanthomonadales bacterium]|nr:alpha/beta hydrolase [Xanthomonadales bacterium]
MRALLVPLALVLAAYAAYCALLFSQQRAMMFPGATMRIAPDEPRPPPGVRSVRFAGGGEAWFRPPATVPGPIVVFAHGNAELIDDGEDVLAGCAAHGLGTLLVEYPGYGRTRGDPSLASLDAAFDAAYDWLAAQPEVDPARIHALGRSVGTGVAARLATRRDVAALVLQSPFTRVADFAWRMGVPPWFVRDPYDNLEAVARYPGPVLVLHGRRDDVIPFAMGEAVARASPRATLVPMDCAHNDCPDDAADYWRTVARFVDAATR